MYDSHKLMYNEKNTIILESYREAKLNSWEGKINAPRVQVHVDMENNVWFAYISSRLYQEDLSISWMYI